MAGQRWTLALVRVIQYELGGGCLHSHLELSGSCDKDWSSRSISGRGLLFTWATFHLCRHLSGTPRGLGGGEHRTVSGLASLPESFSPAISCASRMHGDIIPHQANEFHRKLIRVVFSRTKSSLEIERGKKHKNPKWSFGCKHCSKAELVFFFLNFSHFLVKSFWRIY